MPSRGQHFRRFFIDAVHCQRVWNHHFFPVSASKTLQFLHTDLLSWSPVRYLRASIHPNAHNCSTQFVFSCPPFKFRHSFIVRFVRNSQSSFFVFFGFVFVGFFCINCHLRVAFLWFLHLFVFFLVTLSCSSLGSTVGQIRRFLHEESHQE